MGLAQSTVSQHLKILAEVRFVLIDAVGNARHYRINEACIGCFPSAADLVMGKPAPDAGDGACAMTTHRRSAPMTSTPTPTRCCAIYQAGLDTGQASFETTAPTWEAFDAAKLPDHRHVASTATARARLGRRLGGVGPAGLRRASSSTPSTSTPPPTAAASGPRCCAR